MFKKKMLVYIFYCFYIIINIFLFDCMIFNDGWKLNNVKKILMLLMG